MRYKAKLKREQPGRYRLEYGRGDRKLTDIAYEQDGEWYIDTEGDLSGYIDTGPYGTLKDLKDSWGSTAAEAYENDGRPADTTAIDEGEEDYFTDPTVDQHSERGRDRQDNAADREGEDGAVTDKAAPFPEEMTDYDVLKLRHLVGRYGQENLIKWIRGHDQTSFIEALGRGLRFRRRVFEARREERRH